MLLSQVSRGTEDRDKFHPRSVQAWLENGRILEYSKLL